MWEKFIHDNFLVFCFCILLSIRQAPKKVSPWLDPIDAFDYGNECIQFDFESNEVFGNEDCLYLNVFVPTQAIESKIQSNLSVIVYIMGEAFQTGSSRNYGPDFLLEKDVIVVSEYLKFFFQHQTFYYVLR